MSRFRGPGALLLCLMPVLSAAGDLAIAPGTELFFETPSGRRIATTDFAAGLPAAPFALVGFEAARLPELRAALGALGGREVALIGPGLLLVERGAAPAGARLAGAAGSVPYEAADRVSAELSAGAPLPVETALLIHLMPGAGDSRVTAALARAGAPIVAAGRASGFGRVVTEVRGLDAPGLSRDLARLDEVFFIERVRRVGLLNDRSGGTMQSGVQGSSGAAVPFWNAGIRGEGQVVGEIDTGVDPDSCYFREPGGTLPPTNTWSAGVYGTVVNKSRRKLMAYDFLYSCDQYPGGSGCDNPLLATSWDNQGHGSHVAGNMTGDNLANPVAHDAADGLAPAAKLVAQDGGYTTGDNCADLPGLGCPVISLGPLFAQAATQGVRVHNNSWGDNENAGAPGQSNYTARSRDVDEFAWNNPEVLVVFAAGNSGSGNVDFSVGSPGTAKNSLSVGGTRKTATGSDENIASFSSRGWTGDGRIKPDVMAPANNTSAGSDGNNASQNCGTDTGGGTSYAAPTLAGAAALARQFFTEGFWNGGSSNPDSGIVPSAALLKAVLINSAVSMTGQDNGTGPISPIPSNEQGWGRVRLDRALPLPGSTRQLYVDDPRFPRPAADSAATTYTFGGVEATEPFEVTLAWTDYPATADSAPANPTIANPASWSSPRLVNDFDLTVTGPSGTYKGNVYSAGASVTGGTADRRNNVESVLVAAPTAGTWTVTVTPFSIVQAGQASALAVTGKWASVSDCNPGVPQSVAASFSAGTATVSWAAGAPSGATYRIWRTSGDCVEGPWTLVATTASSPYLDGGLSAGTTWAYRVSAISADGRCESVRSACVVAFCGAVPPVFGGAVSAVADAASGCGVTVSWSAGATGCPRGSVSYNVHRDTGASFTPGPANLIARCLSGTSFHDTSILTSGVPVHYVVRAEDSRIAGSGGCSGGLDDGNLVRVSATPTGVPTVLFSHGFETFPGPWTATNFTQDNSQKRTGTWSAHSANVDNTCSTIRTTAATALPAASSPTLRYSAYWNIESGYDGAIAEIATAAAGPWTRLTPTPAYPGARNTSTSNCLPTSIACYTGAGGWVDAAVSLAAWAGQGVYIRFTYSTDVGGNLGGFWVDDVSISLPGTCTTTVDEVSGAGFAPLLVTKNGASTRLSFQRKPGASLYNAYEGAVGSFYSHGGAGGNVCGASVTDPGDGTLRTDLTASAGDRYYLVTAAGGGVEGAACFATGGAEIPPAQNSCAP